MNRIARRTGITTLIAVFLIIGLGFFLYEYITEAGDWAVFEGNPHLYNGANIDCGIISDAKGKVILDMNGERKYNDDLLIRESTLHWVGDRYGYVSAPAVANHTADLVGYNIFNGLYTKHGNLGGTARLTLYNDVQKAAMEALGGFNGTIGVYNYKTGEILCSVSKPCYDPDDPPEFDQESEDLGGIFLNRFIQSTYTPGSIFKVATTAAALELIPDINDYTFLCDGEYSIGPDTVTCEAVHGYQDLKQAMLNSCNCAYAKLAEVLGKDAIMDAIDRYHLMDSVEFDGITSATGQFDIDDAETIEMDWSAIGQYTDLINPCRYMVFMGAIANGGSCAIPHIVKEIKVGFRTTYRAETELYDSILDPATCVRLSEYMRNNVANNYGDFHFGNLTVCAKSGTSQSDEDKLPNAMFSGFITDSKYPLAFIIVVEEGGYGGMICPPIMGKVLEACVKAIG